MRHKAVKFLIFALLFWMLVNYYGVKGKESLPRAIVTEAVLELREAVYGQFLPGASNRYTETAIDRSSAAWLIRTPIETVFPLLGILQRDVDGKAAVNAANGDMEHARLLAYEELMESGAFSRWEELPGVEGADGERSVSGKTSTDMTLAGQEYIGEGELQRLLREENQAARMDGTGVSETDFVPRNRKIRLDIEDFADYETLVKSFYTIDANTMAGSNQLNLKELLSRDMTLQKNEEGPQILIYHTHSREGFADSVPGNDGTNIVGAGERLAQILRERYGYRVLHHLGRYDEDTRDDAYGRALPALEALLAEYPSIEVVIDLHRDEVAEKNRLVMNLDGRPTARFMFFNGLSRTRKSGDIDYLKNENLSDNLAFSFQLQLKCEEYYPGITRKIYLKGYRYNLHLRPRSLLVELGAQNNTVEEAMNACDPLAHVLDMVLSGTG